MSKKPLAIFTIVKDEPEFLPLWIRHYESQIGTQDDLFILDNQSTEKSVEYDTHRDSIIPVFNDEVNHAWMRDTVTKFQRFLMQSYEAVLFAEVDEFVFCRDGQSLHDYAQWMVQDIVWCTGYEVVQQQDEPTLLHPVYGQLLEKRSTWYRTSQYSKPLLTRIPVVWQLGFHDLDFVPAKTRIEDPNLLLVHLHKLDYGIAQSRHARFSSRKWAEADLRAGHGFQNRYTGDQLKSWFDQNVDAIGTPQPLELIPDDVRRRL